MRRAARTDSNHTDIVEAFRKMGCTVVSLAALGKGLPDICVAYGGMQLFVEIKDGTKPKSARKLTPDQEKFWREWTGCIRLVTKMEDVAETVNTLRRWHTAINARLAIFACPNKGA